MGKSELWRGAAYGIGAASIWGSMYVVSDVTLEVVPPFTLLSMRIVLALLILLPLSRRQPRRLPARPQLPGLLAVGVVGIGISLGAQFLGTDLSTAVNGALVTSASPAFVVLFALLILRERLSAASVMSISTASVGVLIILDPASADFSSETFLGDVFLAAAALTWGLYSVLVRLVSLRYGLPALQVTVVALLGGLIVSLPASLLELARGGIGGISPGIALAVLYLGFVCTAFALLMWNRAFAMLPATIASLCFFAQPLAGAILATVFLGQGMRATLWLGGALIAIGALIALLRQSPAEASQPAET